MRAWVPLLYFVARYIEEKQYIIGKKIKYKEAYMSEKSRELTDKKAF